MMNNQFPAKHTPVQPPISFYNPQKEANSNNSTSYPGSTSTVSGFIPNSKSYIARSNILDPPKTNSTNTNTTFTKSVSDTSNPTSKFQPSSSTSSSNNTNHPPTLQSKASSSSEMIKSVITETSKPTDNNLGYPLVAP